MSRRRRGFLAASLLLVLALAWLAQRPAPALPAGLPGALVFVSDRDGTPALYWRGLPRDRERRLTFGSEAAGEPAVSPERTRVAFSMNGRIGLVSVASGDVAIVTLGVDWKDAQPAWLPDGRRLVVSARRRLGEPAGLHLLEPGPEGFVSRHPLTQPRTGDDESPAASPDGRFVVFTREQHLLRVDLADGRVRRLTGGFKRERSPRFLPDGRIVCAWSEGRRHGIDALDPEGRQRAPRGGRGLLPHHRPHAGRPLPRGDADLGRRLPPPRRPARRAQGGDRAPRRRGRPGGPPRGLEAPRQPLPRVGALSRGGEL